MFSCKFLYANLIYIYASYKIQFTTIILLTYINTPKQMFKRRDSLLVIKNYCCPKFFKVLGIPFVKRFFNFLGPIFFLIFFLILLKNHPVCSKKYIF